MYSYTGLNGTIPIDHNLGIEVRSIQSDVFDAAATDVEVTLSGTLGHEYTFNAITPIVTKLRFGIDETIAVTASGSINNIIINYVKYGSQDIYMQADPQRVHRITPGKWDVS